MRFIVSLGRWLEMGGLHKVQFLRKVVQLALLYRLHLKMSVSLMIGMAQDGAIKLPSVVWVAGFTRSRDSLS